MDPGTPDLKTEVFYPHAIVYKGQQENWVGWNHQREEGQGDEAGEICSCRLNTGWEQA